MSEQGAHIQITIEVYNIDQITADNRGLRVFTGGSTDESYLDINLTPSQMITLYHEIGKLIRHPKKSAKEIIKSLESLDADGGNKDE